VDIFQGRTVFFSQFSAPKHYSVFRCNKIPNTTYIMYYGLGVVCSDMRIPANLKGQQYSKRRKGKGIIDNNQQECMHEGRKRACNNTDLCATLVPPEKKGGKSTGTATPAGKRR
jgi:hypothetical protein